MYDVLYDRLWAEIADLDVPVGIHVAAGNAADVMTYHYLPGLRVAQATMAFTIGNQIASAAFIMGGVLERHPKLRLVHLESGAGWVAFWLDRLAAGVNGASRDIEIAGLKLAPIEYFQRQCYITIGNQIASAAFIMGGVLERHPKLRLVHLESGAGWVAFWLDRLAAGVNGASRDIEIAGLKLAPIE